MINKEPELKVGVLERAKTITGQLKGQFQTTAHKAVSGPFEVKNCGGTIQVILNNKDKLTQDSHLVFIGNETTSFLIHDVIIGIKFHWQRNETHQFCGNLILLADEENTITVINQIKLEDYLQSVISSEMSATAPLELLKAHAITSRSWLVAMLERKGMEQAETSIEQKKDGINEIVRWYGREEHLLFDVCADDHCQRYHGISRIISESAKTAINQTKGMFLISDNKVCDARYSKSCGGITEEFRCAWENIEIPYLSSAYDSESPHTSLLSESDAIKWIHTQPDAYCNTSDSQILKTILPGFDQETADFYRWTVQYTRKELEKLLRKKSGINFGSLKAIEPIERGPSGRIIRLKIVGSEYSVIVGKELEIRRWLAPSHLYSSAFSVQVIMGESDYPEAFVFHGAGWGHGVGLCQIGAAVMAIKGKSAEQILSHYFLGAQVTLLY